MLGASVTSGLWPFLVVAGTALLFLGVVLAISTTMPSYAKKERISRTERGLLFTCLGATAVLVGTSKELLPHLSWPLTTVYGLVLTYVIIEVLRVVLRANHVDRKHGRENEGKRAQCFHHFVRSHQRTSHDEDDEDDVRTDRDKAEQGPVASDEPHES